MNKLTNLKALLLFAFFSLFLLNPASLNAQKSDGFFRGGNDNYENRDDISINDGGGINNYGIGETVPLGSGLLILTAAGAGYAVLRRRRNRNNSARHIAMLFFAVLMLFGMTNCKKKIVETTNTTTTSGVHITLNVDGDNNGSKVIVDPTGHTNPNYATVTFEDDDVIYVAYDGAYVGTLTYSGGTFSGNVDISSYDGVKKLHFYFLGGKGFTPTLDGNTATVVISDQSEQCPVISYYHSTEVYNGSGEYTAKLRNKCSIMKFNVVTESTAPICIMGMNNMVTVDFANPGGSDNGFSYSKYQNIGEIKMSAGAGTAENPAEKWAVVLPQDELAAGTNEAYTAISGSNPYMTGNRPAIPVIHSNEYHSDATERTITVNETPKFSVSATQKVLFAPGNLQATTTNSWSSWTWSFMDHQYSIVEEDFESIGKNYSKANTASSFKWGATGTSIGGYFNPNITVMTPKQLPEAQRHDLRFAYGEEWGKCANDANSGNGLDGYKNWRTPSMAEWTYVASTRTVTTTNKNPYGYAIVEGVKGIVLLPDNWNGAIDPSFVYGSVEGQTNRYSSSTTPSWAAMEAAGVVFLPAAGWRSQPYYVEDVGCYGTYWSIDYDEEFEFWYPIDPDNPEAGYAMELRTYTYCFSFNYYGGDNEELPNGTDHLIFETDWAHYSSCVRLIRNVE